MSDKEQSLLIGYQLLLIATIKEYLRQTLSETSFGLKSWEFFNSHTIFLHGMLFFKKKDLFQGNYHCHLLLKMCKSICLEPNKLWTINIFRGNCILPLVQMWLALWSGKNIQWLVQSRLGNNLVEAETELKTNVYSVSHNEHRFMAYERRNTKWTYIFYIYIEYTYIFHVHPIMTIHGRWQIRKTAQLGLFSLKTRFFRKWVSNWIEIEWNLCSIDQRAWEAHIM